MIGLGTLINVSTILAGSATGVPNTQNETLVLEATIFIAFIESVALT